MPLQKSSMKLRKGRSPLSNISNKTNLPTHRKTVSKGHRSSKIKIAEDEVQPPCKSNSGLQAAFDGISNTVAQIGQLVAHASKLDACNFERFTNILRQTQINLQEWLVKLEDPFCQPAIRETDLVPPSDTLNAFMSDENKFTKNDFAGSLSSSPLVSWNIGVKNDLGDLFILTPCPKLGVRSTNKKLYPALESTNFIKKDESCCSKALTSELPNLEDEVARSQVEAVGSEFPKLQDVVARSQVEAGVSELPKLQDGVDRSQAEAVVSELSKLQSLEVNDSSIMNEKSQFLETSLPGVSSPKSCTFMNTAQQSLPQRESVFIPSTPSTFKFTKCSEDDCDIQVPKSLIKKYSVLLKNEESNAVLTNSSERISLSFGCSPPKTCKLMLPPSDSSSDHISESHGFHKKEKGSSSTNSSPQTPKNCKSDAENESSQNNTRRQPGVETLRKELWSKFEEESTDQPIILKPACLESREDFMSKLNTAVKQHVSPSIRLPHTSQRENNCLLQNELKYNDSTSSIKSTVGGSSNESIPESFSRDKLLKSGSISVLNSMKRQEAVGSSNIFQSSTLRKAR